MQSKCHHTKPARHWPRSLRANACMGKHIRHVLLWLVLTVKKSDMQLYHESERLKLLSECGYWPEARVQ